MFGLVPQYVSIFFVEKYYTNYWTAFWNVFGVSQVTLASLLSTQSLFGAVDLALLFAVLLFVLCLGVLSGSQKYSYFYRRREFYANIVRRIGASWLTTTFSIGLFFGFGVGISVLGTAILMGLNTMITLWFYFVLRSG